MTDPDPAPVLDDIQVAVIDDNRHFLVIMRAMLRACGIRRGFACSSAGDALALLSEHAVDLIMTDCRMPGTDGLQLIRTIRADRRFASRATPIICVSGHAEKRIIEDAIRTGADDFLVKPLSVNIVLQRMTRHLFNRLPYFETATYFGPDRRRILSCTHRGPDRRGDLVEL
jgi:CheY-like chemotaxis protein